MFLGAAAALAAIPSEENAMIIEHCVMQLLEHSSRASWSSQELVRNVRAGDWAFLQLPMYGNNWLAMQRRAQPHPDRQLFFFPEAARAWDVHFISIGQYQVFQMEDYDILKLCPANNFYPYCCYCGKFLLPPNHHRCTLKHQKMHRYVGSGNGIWREDIAQCRAHHMIGLTWPRG